MDLILDWNQGGKYDKFIELNRDGKMIVDTDIYGANKKFHKSTRIEVYFEMSNSGRYCIRLDHLYQGEETIHLNMNEPSRK